MNTIKYLLSLLIISGFVFSGCKKSEGDAKKIISGDYNKVWKTKKEITASGEDAALTKEEKSETITFFNSSAFEINGEDGKNGGTWSYDDAGKNLSLQFQGASVTENFHVVELDDHSIKLQAADGSMMELKNAK